MHYFCTRHYSRSLITLLVLGMLLRSLIAPGYMLDPRPADGSLLAITICNGSAGINAIAGLDDAHNQHHGHHDNNHDHDEQTPRDHGFSACSFWSSSSPLLLTDILLADLSAIAVSHVTISYQDRVLPKYTDRSNLARAPPTLS